MHFASTLQRRSGITEAIEAWSLLLHKTISTNFYAMGCPCAISVSGEDPGETVEAAIKEVERLESAYSRYRPESRTSAINETARCAGSIDVDDETASLLDRAFEYYRRSDGLFDISSGPLRSVWNDAAVGPPNKATLTSLLERIGLEKVYWNRPHLAFSQSGMEIDFGGIAKEYAADQVAQLCRSLGETRGIVDLGGDLALFGANPDGSPWRVGIADPVEPSRAAATLFIEGGSGVATSGDYRRFWNFNGRRYGHILNPLTGWPVEGLLSVTVVADSCVEAGAISTIAILKGDEGISWLSRHSPQHVYVDRARRLGGNALGPRGVESNRSAFEGG
jgi:thiamine biosynthesis lipoprotein